MSPADVNRSTRVRVAVSVVEAPLVVGLDDNTAAI
jgi:hypothetical protein